MANIIKIKRSAVTATPVSLAEGELAYSENSSNLFIGTNGGANIAKIGGNADVQKLAGIEAGAQVNTVDDVNGQTGNVSLGLEDLDDISFAASPNLAIDDMIVFDGVNWVNVPKTDVGVTSHNDLTEIGITSHADIDTHIGAISPHNNWMSCHGGNDFSSNPNSGTGTTNSIAIGGGASATNNNGVAIGTSSYCGAVGNNTIAIGQNSYTTADDAMAVGSNARTTHPGASVFGNGVQSASAFTTRIGRDNNVLEINANSEIKLYGPAAQFVQPNYTTAGLPVGVTGGTVFDTTTTSLKVYNGAAWVDVSPDLSPYALDSEVVHNTGAETIAGAKTFSDDMIVNGDLSVNGTLTTINSEDLIITDNTITLNAGETGAGVTLGTSGILIDRGTADDTQWIWDEATDKWGYMMLAGSPATGTFVPVAEAIHVHDASDITTGTFADARIAESNVTQHEAAINHDALLNFVADKHIAHSGVTLTAGEGLSGGGDITASRTFNLDVNGLVALTETDGSADYMVVYDASGLAHKKILVNNVLDGGNF